MTSDIPMKNASDQTLELPKSQFALMMLGDVRACLRKLPSDSVDTVVTSPPYWSLRDYRIPATVWDGSMDCKHEWGEAQRIRQSWGDTSILDGQKQGTNRGAKDNAAALIKPSNFCERCGAWKGQLGLEPTFQLYVQHMVGVFHEIRRVLKPTGALWLNMGDTYNSASSNWNKAPPRPRDGPRADATRRQIHSPSLQALPEKCLLGIPWRIMLGMVDDGWILRNVNAWVKPNHMPSSVKDRLSNGWEPMFFFTKQPRYWFDLDAIRHPYSEAYLEDGRPPGILRQRFYEGSQNRIAEADDTHIQGKQDQLADPAEMKGQNPTGKNPGDVWITTTQPFKEAHFATFPEALVARPIKASCPHEICVRCGHARERMVERKTIHKWELPKEHPQYRPRPGYPVEGEDPSMMGFNLHGKSHYRGSSETRGWTSCGCSIGFKPGVVLDPFGGSGTVAKVALENHLSTIYIDVKEEYLGMAKRRIDFGHPTIDGSVTWLEEKVN